MHDLVLNGLSIAEAAAKNSISESRLRIIKRSPMWIEAEKALLDEVKDERLGKLQTLIPKALTALDDTVSHTLEYNGVETTNKPSDRLAAAKEILNRTGVGESDNPDNVVKITLAAPKWYENSNVDGNIDIVVSGNK